MLSRKHRSIRYALVLLCLIALLGAQMPGGTAPEVGAQSKGDDDLHTEATFGPVAVDTVNSFPGPSSASPYPAIFAVSGLSGGLVTITVVFNSIVLDGGSVGFMDDPDFILVSPGAVNPAKAFNFWSEAGGSSTGTSFTNVTVADTGATFIPDGPPNPGGPIVSGTTYRPADYNICADGFNAHAGLPATIYNPAGKTPTACGSATFTSVFDGLSGADLNGNWKLYVVDHAADGGEHFSISLNITAGGPTAADGTVSGAITDNNGIPVAGTVVNLSGTEDRKFITDANGKYRFENVETNGFYTVRPARANFDFSPAERSFSLVGNNTDATFTAVPSDDGVNPLDTPEYFVRQNYLDFLGREPDEAGFNFWSDQILGCGGDADCVDRKLTNVSAAYFLSIEFQETGGLVDGLYRVSYGVRPNFAEFRADAARVAPGLVVGHDAWATALENGKAAFIEAFVQRPAFQAAFGGMSNDAYVDALIANTGVGFTAAERSALVSGLGNGMTRAGVLRAIVENPSVVAAKRNEAFVMMEYFGYLRREPDADGYQFWLNKLNQFNGNFEQAEMVRSFIISGEYRRRFPR